MSGLEIKLNEPPPHAVTFTNPATGEVLCHLELDGTLTIVSENYTPNEAAQIFWDAVKRYAST